MLLRAMALSLEMTAKKYSYIFQQFRSMDSKLWMKASRLNMMSTMVRKALRLQTFRKSNLK